MYRYTNYTRYHQVYDRLLVQKFVRASTLLKPHALYTKVAILYYSGFFFGSYWMYRIFYKQLFHTTDLVDGFYKRLYKIPAYYSVLGENYKCVEEGTRRRYYYHNWVKYVQINRARKSRKGHGGVLQRRREIRYQPVLKYGGLDTFLISNLHKIKQFIHVNSVSRLPLHFMLALVFLGVLGGGVTVNKTMLKLILGYQTIHCRQLTANVQRYMNLLFITFYQSLRHMKIHSTRHVDFPYYKRVDSMGLVAYRARMISRYYHEYAYGKYTRFGYKRGLVINTHNVFRYYVSPYNLILDLLNDPAHTYVPKLGYTPWTPQVYLFHMADFIKYYVPSFWFFYYVGALSKPYCFWGNSEPFGCMVSVFTLEWFLLFFIRYGAPDRCFFRYRNRLAL